MIGPAAARAGGRSSGVRGYADLLHLDTMTVPSLAFAATLVGFFGWSYCIITSPAVGRFVTPSPPTQRVLGHPNVAPRVSTI